MATLNIVKESDTDFYRDFGKPISSSALEKDDVKAGELTVEEAPATTVTVGKRLAA